MKDSEIEALLLVALGTSFGVKVQTTSADLLKRKLYVVRNAARKRGDSSFDELNFRTSPDNPTGEVWIVKGNRDGKER